jgi:hypothetical protein
MQDDFVNGIDPTRLYSAAEVCVLVPSPRCGEKTHIKTGVQILARTDGQGPEVDGGLTATQACTPPRPRR